MRSANIKFHEDGQREKQISDPRKLLYALVTHDRGTDILCQSCILTNSMEQSPYSEANSHSAGQEIPRILWFITVFDKGQPLVHVLSQMNSVHILQMLTPWSRVLEKLTATQLVKKFPAFYGTRRFITVFTTARHWSLF